MSAAGVDAALLVTSAVYGPDNGYPLEAAARHPDRFGVIGRIDPAAPDLDARVAGWRDQPGMLGIRLIIGSDAERTAYRSGWFDPLFAACARHQVPICLYPPGILPELGATARAHPELVLVIDHLGLSQPPLMPADPDPFGRLPELLALSRHRNVNVKLTGAPTLSTRPYPYDDLWPAIHRVLEAFGPERVMWGSDITRTGPLHSYQEAAGYIRDTAELPATDKRLVLGASLRRVFGWNR
jgi:L-fuconolactonase